MKDKIIDLDQYRVKRYQEKEVFEDIEASHKGHREMQEESRRIAIRKAVKHAESLDW